MRAKARERGSPWERWRLAGVFTKGQKSNELAGETPALPGIARMAANDDQSSPQTNWPKDFFGQREVGWQLGMLLGPLLLVVLIFLVVPAKDESSGAPVVVIYASQDQVYAEPILKEFEKQTGIKARAVYDSEAVKTVGLANRLLAERSNPQCDVFWNNEELRTRQLAAQDIFRETNK